MPMPVSISVKQDDKVRNVKVCSNRLYIVEGIDFGNQLEPETKQRIQMPENCPLETCDTTPSRAAPVAEVSAATSAVIQLVYTSIAECRMQWSSGSGTVVARGAAGAGQHHEDHSERPEAQTELEGVDGEGHQGLAHVVVRGEAGAGQHHDDH